MAQRLKIAIIHDWLTGMRGGEKCLEAFCEIYPQAAIYTLLHAPGSVSDVIESMEIHTSFLQKIPGISKNYRNFLPLFPLAIESFDLSGYDVILSSSHCVAKGVKNTGGALHICYCYTPVRYAWIFYKEYFERNNPLKRYFISRYLSYLRKWDIKSNKDVDYFIAISDNVKNRIGEFYNRDADVIYPPVSLGSQSSPSKYSNGTYLIVSALVPYKKVDLAIRAFNETGKELVIVGTGDDEGRLKAMARPNISFKGWATDDELDEYYSSCRAVIFPGEEDFGIVPLEAQLRGKPVIAFGAGGVLETVVPAGRGHQGPTGVFFEQQTPAALNGAVKFFEDNYNLFDPGTISESVKKFGRDNFKRRIEEYIAGKWEKHNAPD